MLNLITDVAGVTVGSAQDAKLASGVEIDVVPLADLAVHQPDYKRLIAFLKARGLKIVRDQKWTN